AVGDDLLVNAAISGDGFVGMISQSGRLVLTGASTVTGPVIINQGELELRGATLADSEVRVLTPTGDRTAAVLVGGDSTIEGLTVISGTVSLLGTLHVSGFADLAGLGTPGGVLLDVLVSGTLAGQFGRIVADGGIDLGNGTTELQVRLTGNITSTIGLPIL